MSAARRWKPLVPAAVRLIAGELSFVKNVAGHFTDQRLQLKALQLTLHNASHLFRNTLPKESWLSVTLWKVSESR
jgi:hypothetical protein